MQVRFKNKKKILVNLVKILPNSQIKLNYKSVSAIKSSSVHWRRLWSRKTLFFFNLTLAILKNTILIKTIAQEYINYLFLRRWKKLEYSKSQTLPLFIISSTFLSNLSRLSSSLIWVLQFTSSLSWITTTSFNNINSYLNLIYLFKNYLN